VRGEELFCVGEDTNAEQARNFLREQKIIEEG